MDRMTPNDHSKDAMIRRTMIWIVSLIAIIAMLILVSMGLLIGYPWWLTLATTLSVIPFTLIGGVFGYKLYKQMYK